MKKVFKLKIIYENKKALRRYKVLDKIEAGIVLTGAEVKAAKNHQINLSDAYAQIIGEEVWLIGAHISPYKFSRENLDPKRTRKLLLKKREISHLIGKLQKGITLIPLEVHLKKDKIKIELGMAKGLKLFDKKRQIKEKELKREIKRELKNLT